MVQNEHCPISISRQIIHLTEINEMHLSTRETHCPLVQVVKHIFHSYLVNSIGQPALTSYAYAGWCCLTMAFCYLPTQGNYPIPSNRTCCDSLPYRMQTMLKCVQTSAVRLSSLQCFYRQQVRKMGQSFYDFKAVNLKGEEVSFSKYKGKVVLIENVASLWGTTVRDYTQVRLYLRPGPRSSKDG